MITEYNVILGIVLFFNTATLLFLGHLITFHVYLQSKRLSTYDYIQIQQNKQNYKSKIFRQVNQMQEKQELTEGEIAPDQGANHKDITGPEGESIGTIQKGYLS